ncbi:MAG: hypothetical protein AAF226_13965 [Verrucomicrobiota bacterium]
MNMLRVVLWKEWRGLQPVVILMLVIFVAGLFMSHFSEFVDEFPIWENVIQPASELSFFPIILSLIASFGLFTLEKDERTLTYLDGLPISRSLVFACKWLIAVTIISVLGWIWTCEALLYNWFSKESTSLPTPWRAVVIDWVL